MTPEMITQLVGGLGAALLAWQGKRITPLLRMIVRLALDIRRRQRRYEAALLEGKLADGNARARTPTPQPDELELAAQRALDSTDR